MVISRSLTCNKNILKHNKHKIFLRGISKYDIGSDFQRIQDWNSVIVVISI